MDEANRTRAELLAEVAALRSQVAELGKREASRQQEAARRKEQESPAASEGALGESEHQLQAVLDAMFIGLLVADAETRRFCLVNPAACRMLGYSKDELLQLSVPDVHSPDALPRVAEAFAKLASGETDSADGIPFRRKDGTIFVADVSSARLYYRGRPCVTGVIRDATERQRVQEALRAGEARYRAVVESQTELICRFGAGCVLTFVNEAYCRYFGRSAADLVGRSFLSLIPESDRRAVTDRLAAISPANPIFSHEHPVLHPSGEVRWMHWVNRGTFDKAGCLVEYQAVGRDVTDRKRAEEALQQSEARYRAVVESQTELITRFLPDGTRTFSNEAICRFWGRRREELLGRSFLADLSKDEAAHVAAHFATLTPEHPVGTYENQIVTPSGGTRRMHWRTQALFDDQGHVTEFQAVGRDLTELKLAEEALRQSEENFRHLFEQSLDGIVVVIDDRIVSANQAFADIHRTPLLEVLGREATDFMHPDERAVGLERIRAAARGETLAPSERQCRNLRADGSTVLVEVRSRGVRWAGRPATLVILRDISQRVRLEEELREAQKMEAVGQLAGGIAHDFNNLVTGILCHTSLLKISAESPAEVRETAGVIEGAARRAAQLTSQLLGFARRGKHQNVPVDLNASVQACINLFSHSLDPRIRVVTQFNTDRAMVRGDPVQMEQVILNLALNARDAMPDGGEMVFATDVADVTEQDRGGHVMAQPGRYVVLSVKDTGHGIPEELRSRIFEPFFTTKPRGKGTGMGLPMVYGIAKNHGGWAELDSAAVRGATFRVFLPQATDAIREPAARTAAEPTREAPGRVLVVDDEQLVRDAVCRMLEDLGYDAVPAADGQQAVELYRKLGRDIRLVIIDMIMPQMDGRQCFLALRQLNPAVKVILSTGDAADGTVQEILDSGGADFVQKPYEVHQLAVAIQRALAN
jgi:hypothetical protein